MADLKAKPFYLTDSQIRWVEDTLASMTLDEKLSQLFVLLKAVPGVDEGQIKNLMETARPGGMRWQGGDKHSVWRQNRYFQQYSRVPVLIAGNCDDGGNGVLSAEGTFVATAAQAGASEGTQTAYHMGYVAGREAAAIGVNWMFNPVADVYKNWRNTIVNTRSFGSDPDRVIECVRAYIRGIKDATPHMACTCKHFPGDDWDELDPHISPAHNEAGVEEWTDSYGRVYRTMIEEGLETVMTGQISLPAMSRKLRPGIRNEAIMPASLAPELLNDLLRGELGFNGLIISDASHMIGMSGVMARSEAVPRCIAAGCDMFLFANDFEEDLGYLKAGYQAFILRYSLDEQSVWPNPLDDYEQAMALIRQRADEWHVARDRIAVVGFSAGGHLATCAATMSKHRPNAAILGYPVIDGDCVREYQKTAPDVVAHVNGNTCPCFVFATRTDNLVPAANTIHLIDALYRKEVAFESHIYSNGPHGLSTGDASIEGNPFCDRYPRWVEDSIAWLAEVLGGITPRGLAEPRFGAKVNGNRERTLNLDCTLAHLRGNPAARALLDGAVPGTKARPAAARRSSGWGIP